METFIEILKYTLPSFILLLAVWILIRYFFNNWNEQRRFELLLKNQKTALPMRMQAYERMALFLERITVDSLLVREQNNELNCRDSHQHLLSVIRTEYEHNLSQQVYLSTETWQMIKNAKEGVIKIVNSAAMQVNPDGKALELSKKIIDLQIEVQNSPTQIALDFLRNEAGILLGRK